MRSAQTLGPLNSTSSHSSCNQLRTAGAIAGPELQTPFILDSKSTLKGSSDAQPPDLNSTVDPSRCLHLKLKFMRIINSKFHAFAPAEDNQSLRTLTLQLGVIMDAPDLNLYASSHILGRR